MDSKALKKFLRKNALVIIWLLITALVRYYDKVQTEKIESINYAVRSIDSKLDQILMDRALAPSTPSLAKE